ncbi:hypothetical protein C8F01DRAFT_1288312 [Mycena amicta]|nr:hypothetical protein C8F01DRAFT_1288312 [Mycena amicta]
MGQLQMGTAVGRNSGRQETRREPINPALVTDRPLRQDGVRSRRVGVAVRHRGGELEGVSPLAVNSPVSGLDTIKALGRTLRLAARVCSFGEGRFSWGSGVEMVITEGLQGGDGAMDRRRRWTLEWHEWLGICDVTRHTGAPQGKISSQNWSIVVDGASEVLLDYVECGPAEICWSRKGREDDEDRSVTLATLFGSPRAQHGWARAMADDGQAAGGAGGWEQAGAGPSRPAWVNPGRGRRGAVPGGVGHD